MIYRFGHLELDVGKVELRAGGVVCPLEPQVFALLALLVENRERLVSKEEIIEKVWDGRIVSDAAIASRIKSARQAVGDDDDAQRFIKTIHRRGFRFVAEVTVAQGARLADPAAIVSGDLSTVQPHDQASRSPGAHVLIALIAAVAHGLAGDEPRAASWAANVRARNAALTRDDFFRAFPTNSEAAKARISNVLARFGF